MDKWNGARMIRVQAKVSENSPAVERDENCGIEFWIQMD